jgi:hypothetical protein
MQIRPRWKKGWTWVIILLFVGISIIPLSTGSSNTIPLQNHSFEKKQGFIAPGDLYNINYWYIDEVWFGQMSMETEYNQTVNVNINAGQTMNVDLPDWTPADMPQYATEIDSLVDAFASMNNPDGYPIDNDLSALITLRYEHDVGVSEITKPPHVPKDSNITWFTYGGDNANSIGLTSGGTFEGAIRLSPTELAPYDGQQITTVKYCHGMLSGSGEPATDGFFKFYGPGTTTQPGALLHSEAFHTPQGNDWFTYTLTWPFIVNASQDLWFSIECDNTPAGAYPLGVDAGPAVDTKADWASLDGGATWIELQIYGLDYNWNHMVGFEMYTPSSPPGTYEVEATVTNFGYYFSESNIPVEARFTHVDNDTVIYDHTATIPGPLAPNQTTSVQFPDITIANLTEWEGMYKLEIWTSLPGDDHPENDKKIAYYEIHIPDFIPPITNHTIQGTMGLQGWYVSNVIITLNAYDPSQPVRDRSKSPSGVRFTYYKLHDADPWTLYNDPSVIVSTDGRYELYYYSDDWAGNVEEPKGPFPFKVDKNAPTIELFASKTGRDSYRIWADTSDTMSGVSLVEFYLNDHLIYNDTTAPYEWNYSGPSFNLDAIVYDNAGNSALAMSFPSPGKFLVIGRISNPDISGSGVVFFALHVIVIEYGLLHFHVSTLVNQEFAFSQYKGIITDHFMLVIYRQNPY